MTHASVIIPTRNRADTLETTLLSVLRQNVPASDFEIVVVDNGSTDNTPQVVAAIAEGHRAHRVRYVYEAYPGLLAGRHRGFREAASELLLYIDDDIEASERWLSTICECFRDEQVSMVGGNILPKFESAPPSWLEKMWEPSRMGRQLGYLSLFEGGKEASWMDPTSIWGCNFPVRRSAVVDAGGFGPEVYPQQSLMKFLGDCEVRVSRAVERCGRKARFHPGASILHLVPTARMSVAYFARKAYTDGIRASYRDIREAGGLRGSREIEPPVTFRSRLGTMAERLLAALRLTPVWLARRQIWRSYRAGYAYHKQEAASDPAVLNWILQDNYWDFTLPVPIPPAN